MSKFLSVILIPLMIVMLVVGCTGNQMSQEENELPDETELSDGVFEAEEEDFDDHGWKGIVSVTVENGEITEVDFDEVNEDGDLKSEDTDYSEKMKEQKGVTPAEAYEEFESSLIEKQSIEQLDGVSGATASFDKFKGLVDKALKQ
jgi:major membrane immunogen (membrane-anchored lipoprotein)